MTTYQGSCHCGRVKFEAVGEITSANCGIHLYGEGTAPSGEATAAINLRCIEGIDLGVIPVKHFDGRAL